MPWYEHIKSIPEKFPGLSAAFGVVVVVQIIWSLGSTQPLIVVLVSLLGVRMPAFSPYWITIPFALIPLAVGLYYDRKRNSRLASVSASLAEKTSQFRDGEFFIKVDPKDSKRGNGSPITQGSPLWFNEVDEEQYDQNMRPDALAKAHYLLNLERETWLSDKQRLEMELQRCMDGSRDEYTVLSTEFRALREQCARWRISACGQTGESLNLSLSVQFIEPKDADLAKKIMSLFATDWPNSQYSKNARPIMQVPWRENPCESARVVLFQYHSHGAGICAAINDGDLIGIERVEHIDLQREPPGSRKDAADLTFVIFPKKGKR